MVRSTLGKRSWPFRLGVEYGGPSVCYKECQNFSIHSKIQCLLCSWGPAFLDFMFHLQSSRAKLYKIMYVNLPYAICEVCGSRFPVLTKPVLFDEAIRRLVCGCIFCGASSRVTIVVESVHVAAAEQRTRLGSHARVSKVE
jgi:hypothetical protein